MNLIDLQRDFRAWIADSSEEAALRMGEAARPGLDVYRNNYRAALVACLSEAFERVRLWIGEERFLSTARAHIDANQPRAWTLDAYAGGFPETLELLFHDDPEIAEIGWLDLALSEAFVGPDADPVELAGLADVDWDDAVLRLVPTFRSKRFGTNAAAIWSALSAGEMPPPAGTLPEAAVVLVWRKELISCFRTADPEEAAALELVREGATFGRLCAGMIVKFGEEEGVAAAGRLLGQWIGDGLITAIE